MKNSESIRNMIGSKFIGNHYKHSNQLLDDIDRLCQEVRNEQCTIPVVGRWRFLNDRSDFEEMPKKGDFRCLFSDGSACNYFDEHPIAIMVAWRPL